MDENVPTPPPVEPEVVEGIPVKKDPAPITTKPLPKLNHPRRTPTKAVPPGQIKMPGM